MLIRCTVIFLHVQFAQCGCSLLLFSLNKCEGFFLIGGHLNRFMKKTWSIEDSRCCIICLYSSAFDREIIFGENYFKGKRRPFFNKQIVE